MVRNTHGKSEEMGRTKGMIVLACCVWYVRNVARDNVKLRLVKLYARMFVLCFNYVHDQREQLIVRSIKRGRIDK